MVKKLLVAVLVLILLALDWAALHDILQANEPDLVGEYATLAFSIITFGVILWLGFWNKPLRKS